MRARLGAAALVGTACGGAEVPCDAERCAPVCEAAAPAPDPDAPSAGEAALLDPVLEDLRAGVRPWNEQGIGICAGRKDCGEFLGADPGELPRGDYLVKAELRVPMAGGKNTWKVHFETECKSERASAEETVIATYSRDYDVWYTGPDKGFKLLPLKPIESPAKDGPQRCTWSLTADATHRWSGSWRVPGKR